MSDVDGVSHFVWAKLPRSNVGGINPSGYHPLACHMLDAASVADELWQAVLPSSMRSWISRSLGLAEEDAQRWCSFLVGAHDLGKASPVFQQKGKALQGLLEGRGLRFPGT